MRPEDSAQVAKFIEIVAGSRKLVCGACGAAFFGGSSSWSDVFWHVTVHPAGFPWIAK